MRPTWDVLDGASETLNAAWVAQSAWSAWVKSLPAELTTHRDIGGGKTITVPLWVAEVWDCDNHAWSFWEFVMRCQARWAVTQGKAAAGTAAGTLGYVAEPKAGNVRQGGHDVFWFVDDAGTFRVFEPADGQMVTLTPTETLSVFTGECR